MSTQNIIKAELVSAPEDITRRTEPLTINEKEMILTDLRSQLRGASGVLVFSLVLKDNSEGASFYNAEAKLFTQGGVSQDVSEFFLTQAEEQISRHLPDAGEGVGVTGETETRTGAPDRAIPSYRALKLSQAIVPSDFGDPEKLVGDLRSGLNEAVGALVCSLVVRAAGDPDDDPDEYDDEEYAGDDDTDGFDVNRVNTDVEAYLETRGFFVGVIPVFAYEIFTALAKEIIRCAQADETGKVEEL